MPRRSPLLPPSGYDPVARGFHWLMAVIVLGLIALGVMMTNAPVTTEAQAAETFRLYSLHKTIGVLALALGLGRIFWTLRHPRPGPIHPDRRLENFAAALTHATLYGALVALPLSGWLHHAARPGFAPIYWPFGQGLPLIPASEGLANTFQTLHRLAGYALYAALALHLTGTFRHVILDQDATLSRMTTGHGPAVTPGRPPVGPSLVALAIWAGVIVAGVYAAPAPEPDPFADLDAGTGEVAEEPAPAP